MKKRLFATLLALTMLCAVFPAVSLAGDTELMAVTMKAKTLSYRMKGSISSAGAPIMRDGIMWVDFWNGSGWGSVPFESKGVIELVAPDGTKTVPQRIKEGSKIYYCWDVKDEDLVPGKYTVNWYDNPEFDEDGGLVEGQAPTNSLERTMVQVELKIDGEQGSFLAEPPEPFFAFTDDTVDVLGLPGIETADENSGLTGWQDEETGAITRKIPEDTDGDGKVTLKAVIGRVNNYDFDICYADSEGENAGKSVFIRDSYTGRYSDSYVVDLGVADVGYSDGSVKPVKLVIKNTGNMDFRLSSTVNCRAGYLKAQIGSELKPGESMEVELRPNLGLGVGSYEDYIYVSNDKNRAMRKLNMKFSVVSRTIVIKPKNIEKVYGQTVSPSEVDFEVLTEGVDKASIASGMVFYCDGFDKGAVAGFTYPYRFDSLINGCSIKLADDGPYGVTVKKADPVVETEFATGISEGKKLKESLLSGKFKNPHTDEYVPGRFEWMEPEKVMEKGTTIEKYRFIPDDVKNYNIVENEEITVTVSEKTATEIKATDGQNLNPVYDAKPHGVEFTADHEGEITVRYRKHGSTDEWSTERPIDAGSYDVIATMESDDEYAFGTGIANLTIKPREITSFLWNPTPVSQKVYNGRNDAPLASTPAEVYYRYYRTVDGKQVQDDVRIKRENFTAVFTDPRAGEHDIEIILHAEGALTGAQAGCYVIPHDITYHAKARILQRTINITVPDKTKYYGQTISLNHEDYDLTAGSSFVQGETKADAKVVLSSDGTAAGAEVGEYGIKATTAPTSNYSMNNFASSFGKITVLQAEPGLVRGNVAVSNGKAGNKLSTVSINATFENPYTENEIEGVLEWENAEQIIQEGDKEYEWIFRPKDTKNYTERRGSVTVTGVAKTPAHIDVKLPENRVYDGTAKVVRVETDSDGEVTVQYQKTDEIPRDEGMDSPSVEGEEAEPGETGVWSDEAPVDAGNYLVKIEVGATEEYAANSTVTVLNIAPAELVVGQVTASGLETGQYLSESQLDGVFTGVDGQSVSGVLRWRDYGERPASQVVAVDYIEYEWEFDPDSDNYRQAVGKLKVSVTLTRAPSGTVVYNLPGDDGNYGYINVDGVNVKPGDKVAFYSYKRSASGAVAETEPTNPESGEVVIDDNMLNQRVRILLDNDALSVQAGEIYVRIAGSTKYETVKYKNELGFTVDPAEITVKPGRTSDVKVLKSDADYEISSVAWLVDGDKATVQGDKETATVTGVDSGRVTLSVTAAFKHPDPAIDENVTVIQTAAVTVTERAPSKVTVSLPEQTYDGNPKRVSAEADRPGDITVEYAPAGTESWSSEPPVNAGSYRVRATIAQTEDYLAHTTEAELVINPLEVNLDLSGVSVEGKVYDGTRNAVVSGTVKIANKVGDDDVSVDADKVTAEFADANAGPKKAADVTVPSHSLTGSDAGNYTMTAPAKISVYADIEQMPVAVTPVGITKYYGETKVSSDVTFTNDGGVPNEELRVVFGSEGFAPGAAVKDGAYPFTIEEETAANYSVYIAEDAANVGVTVEKATPEKEFVEAAGIRTQVALSNSTLTGQYENPYTDTIVDGAFDWIEPGKTFDVAGAYDVEYKFTPADGANYNAVTGDTVKIIVSDKTPTNIVASSGANLRPTYDGKEKTVEFTADREGEMEITYDYGDGNWVDKAPVKAGTYGVRAYMEKTDEFAPGLANATLTILPLAVTLDYSGLSVDAKIYDGTVDAKLSGSVAVGNLVEGDRVSVPADAVTAVFDSASAGAAKNVTVNVAADSLTGSDADNYTLAAATHHMEGSIDKRPVNLTASAEKEYGSAITLGNDNFEVSPETPLVSGETKADIYAELSSDGASAEAEVGSYAITAAARSATNYEIGTVTGQVTVNKATPSVDSVSAGNGLTGNALSTVILSGSFENPNNGADVAGTLDWETPDDRLSEGSHSYGWIFTPKDINNYNSPVRGFVTVTASDKKPASLKVNKPENLVYDGKEKTFTADTDADAEVTVEYRTHSVDVQSEVMTLSVIDELAETWTNKAPVDAGKYDVRVSVPETEKLGANTIIETFVIEQAVPSGGVTAADVEEGSYLSESALTNGFKNVDADPLAGALAWNDVGGLTPEQVLVLEDTEYAWTFVPEDLNYSTVTGTVKIRLTPNTREAAAVIYNVPGEDYAYVNVDGVNLQEGDTVTFYMDKEMTDPVSESVFIPKGTAGQFKIVLDGDALTANAGTVYVAIGSSRAVTAVDYKAEVGFILEPDELIITVGNFADINAEPVDASYEIESADWFTNDANIAAVTASDTSSATVGAVAAGSAILTVSLTFKHPDPAAGEKIVVTVTAPITVTDKEKTTVTVTAENTVYNGKPQPVEAKADRDGEVTVTYRPVGGGESAWTEDAPVNAGAYEVKAAIDETDRYASAVATAMYSIAKADPEGTAVASAVEAGETLSSSVLVPGFVGVDSNALEGTLAWDNVEGGAPETVVVDGEAEYGWTFTPEDSVNYNSVSGRTRVVLTGIANAAYSDGKVTFTLTLSDETVEFVDIYVAEYKGGSLLKAAAYRGESAASAGQSFALDYERMDENSELKIMVWNAGSMEPAAGGAAIG